MTTQSRANPNYSDILSKLSLCRQSIFGADLWALVCIAWQSAKLTQNSVTYSWTRLARSLSLSQNSIKLHENMWNAIEMQSCISLPDPTQSDCWNSEIYWWNLQAWWSAHAFLSLFCVLPTIWCTSRKYQYSLWQFERSSPLKPVPSELSSFPHCSTDLVKETE